MNLADDGAQALNTIPSSDHEYRYIVLQSILACELKCMASSRGSQLYFSLEVPCFGAYLWLPTQLIMWRVFFSVTFCGYHCGWMVLSMYLVFYGWMSYLVVSLEYELGN